MILSRTGNCERIITTHCQYFNWTSTLCLRVWCCCLAIHVIA